MDNFQENDFGNQNIPDTSEQYQEYSYGASQYNYSAQSNDSSVENTAKKGHSTWVLVLSIVLSALIGFGGSFLTVYLLGNNDGEQKTLIEKIISKDDGGSTTENISINVDENASSIAQAVAQKAINSVVGIRVTASGSFGSSGGSEGSGVVYTKDGYIITNYHVIESAVSYKNSSISVFFNSNPDKAHEAKVIGYNIAVDLAVIKIEADKLTPVEIGNSDNLKLGQYAVTIGSPGGLEFMGSVTYGIISGLDRQVSSDSEIGLIQTDAAINPGNSGGALLDSSGKLIGINSSKIVAEDFEGMGFAIPVNEAVKICDKIIENKDKPEPYLGISINERYTADILEIYGYPAGAVVYSVASGSPAENAGIRKNDIITAFDGYDIEEYSELPVLVKEYEPGDRVEVEIYRNGRYISVYVTIGSNS